MVWLTFWPLVFGFALSGVIQGVVPRRVLRERLGTTDLSSHALAAALGALSSSCSYAASSMSRALFARGATWNNSVIFMVASTNLVVELAVVLAALVGWPFVLAQLVGGVVMIVLLGIAVPLAFSRSRRERLRAHVGAEEGSDSGPRAVGPLDRASVSARYTVGDLAMVRREMLAGFLVAGFLSVHVPRSWWSAVFLHGHGVAALAENVVLAPLVSVLAFVCSVGNVPLAAALWGHGVAFGGVIAFLFADLVTLPLLAIYRRYYGTGAALGLLGLLWLGASVAGFVVDLLFRALGLVPSAGHLRVLAGDFPLGATAALNALALVLLVVLWRLARRDVGAFAAIDPVCGMSVEPASAPAYADVGGERVYFCSTSCREAHLGRERERQPAARAHVDPVCAMVVRDERISEVGSDGLTYYFCGEGCRTAFRASSGSRGAHDKGGG